MGKRRHRDHDGSMNEDLPNDDGDRLVDQLPPPPAADAVPFPSPRTKRAALLIRSTTDRYLAGIAGAIGRRLDVDPFFIRIALVGSTLLLARDGGAYAIPLLGYFAGWMILPSDRSRPLLGRIGERGALQEMAGAAALLVLSLVVIDRPSLVWAGILLGAAVMLLADPSQATVGSNGGTGGLEVTQNDPDSPVMPSEGANRERSATWGRSLRGAIGPRGDTRPPRPERIRRQRRSPALWPLTAALLLAYSFGCVLLDNLLDPGLDPGIAVNGALMVIGGVILLSAWRGRALLTSLLVLPLIPAWIAFSMADTPRFEDSEPLPGPQSALADGQVVEQSMGYGGLLMRLDRYDLPEGGDVTARAELTAGQIDIWVPKEADLHIVGHIGLGQIEVYEESDGFRSSSEPLMDWGLDRSFAAVGRQCQSTVGSGLELRDIAAWSLVAVPLTADDEQLAAAIEAAGYPRPEPTESVQFIEEPFEYDEFGNPVDIDGQPMEPTSYWSYETNVNGGLCAPKPPPANPTTITIDATVGLGNLKVHRV